MELNNSTLHHAIITTLLGRGWAPSVDELCEIFGTDRLATTRALRDLAEYHGVVLHPQSDEVWIIHPFSTAPTGFVVRAGDREWFGNCAWCSLGVAALAGGTAAITTALGGTGNQVTIQIERGDLLDKSYVVHFPVRMADAWDNVVYTCTMMQLFRDESEVERWCAKHGKPKGDVRPVNQVWRFAKDWYGRHADVDWRKWTPDEAVGLFRRHGLNGPIWELPAGGDRF